MECGVPDTAEPMASLRRSLFENLLGKPDDDGPASICFVIPCFPEAGAELVEHRGRPVQSVIGPRGEIAQSFFLRGNHGPIRRGRPRSADCLWTECHSKVPPVSFRRQILCQGGKQFRRPLVEVADPVGFQEWPHVASGLGKINRGKLLLEHCDQGAHRQSLLARVMTGITQLCFQILEVYFRSSS